MIEISRIRIDGGTQTRAELNQETVAEYAATYQHAASTMPPVTLFFDGSEYWLADGFHRYFAAKKAGKESIAEEVIPGTVRDAILFSLSANSRHGLKRSNADKRRAVETLLADAEWSKWSNEKIAAACAVSPHTVADIKKSHSANAESEVVTYTTKHGTTTAMNTANIGKNKSKLNAGSKTTEKPSKQDDKPRAEQKPAEDEPPEYTALDEAQDTIRGLQDALALANSGHLSDEDREQAAELIARLREENRILTLKVRALTISRDQYQTENGELKKQITRQRREIDKLAGTRTA